jgi:hypothetical protein
LFRVVLGLRGTKKNVQGRPPQKKFLKSYVTPLYLLKIVVPKFHTLTVTGMALCLILGQNVKFILLSLTLSRIKFILDAD